MSEDTNAAEVTDAATAMKSLSAAMKEDPEYAWGWQSNLAMMAVDAGASHGSANQRAADFMQRVFDVDIRALFSDRLQNTVVVHTTDD